MTGMDMDRTRAVRAWLAGGSEELSPRVRDNVLREFPLMSQDMPYWAAAWPQFSSFAAGAAVGAAAVMLVVAVIGAGLFSRFQPGGTAATSTPTQSAPSATPRAIDYSYRDVGFIGLPPRDATPSDPTDTELIESFLRRGPPYKGAAFLYADGRLIWNEYFGDKSTGWLEQSLTDDGIALVRALPLQTWMGQRVLSPEELPGLLPNTAWADQTVRPYVPSGFAACLNVSEQVNPFTESNMTQEEILAALPRAAADLLRDRPPVVDSSDSYGADPFDCLGLDVADARRLDAALRAAGFEQDAWIYHKVLDRPEAGTWWLNIFLEPILPDGTITCSSCG
jgi:hypothetical protein